MKESNPLLSGVGRAFYQSTNPPKWSAWQDSNLRSPRSKRGSLAADPHPETGAPYGNRIRLPRVTGGYLHQLIHGAKERRLGCLQTHAEAIRARERAIGRGTGDRTRDLPVKSR